MDAGEDSEDSDQELEGDGGVDLFDETLSCGVNQRVALLLVHYN